MEPQTYNTAQLVELLGVSRIRVNQFVHEGRLTLASPKRPWQYTAESVHRLIAARELKQRKLLKRPRSHRFRLVETDLLPGDPLLPSTEVAAILDVSLNRVQELVRTGRLRAFQNRVAKAGSPLLIPLSFVTDLLKNDDYQARRKRWEGSDPDNPKPHPPWTPPGASVPIPAWRPTDRSRAAMQINHGRYYSTAQAAAYLGVTPAQVLRLRKTGRLVGYHRDDLWDYRKSLQIGPSIEEKWNAAQDKRRLKQLIEERKSKIENQKLKSYMTEAELREVDEVRMMLGWNPDIKPENPYALTEEEKFQADPDDIILAKLYERVKEYDKQWKGVQRPRWFFLKEDIENLPSVYSWRKAHVNSITMETTNRRRATAEAQTKVKPPIE